MALLNAIVAFIGRTVGKILSALLDWAVVALFGRVAGHRKYVLLGLMAAAAAWPILLFGVLWPKVAVFVVAFVPLSGSVATGWIRPIWIALALLVPVAVGLTLTLQAPPERRKGMLAGILRGFPITAGLAAAFLILLATVPVLRVVSALRGREDSYVPLVTTDESYRVAADLVAETLRRHDIPVVAAAPPWWSALPSRILRRVGKSAFADYVAELAVYLRSPELEVTFYPNTLLLRGAPSATARAHALVIEAVTGQPDMFQTLSPRAQEIERQIQRVWAAYRVNPDAHENAPALLSRLEEITREMAQHPLAFEEWQVIYRQVLQLGRALTGHRQILEQTLPGESTMTQPTTDSTLHSALDLEARSLSTRELVGRVLKAGSLLVAKEVELARAEIKADLDAELGMVKLLIAAALAAVLGLNLLLVSAVFALTHWLPAWLAALGLGGLFLVVSLVLGLIGWNRRVSSPLAITRKTVKEDMQWAKERLA
jgi:Putative Actinobacterial Holin-X, holin superfamily III